MRIGGAHDGEADGDGELDICHFLADRLPIRRVQRQAMYNCKKCPGYCCSYPLIALTKRDVERLAKHFGLDFASAKAKFTVERWGSKYSMRRKADKLFGGVCRFFDTEKRSCSVYSARPSLCRAFPGGRCGYYDFLSFERRAQDDPDFIATTNNK